MIHRNKKEKSKIVIKIAILLSFIAIFLVIIQAFSGKKYNNELNNRITNKEINISEYRIKSMFNKNIRNRIIMEVDNKVLVGETDKQIENEYYDIKAYIQNNNSVVIYLNKLWKEFDIRLYEEEYLTEVVESIKDILDINVPLEKIYDYILSGYLEAKKVDNSKDNNEYILRLNDYVIKGKVLEKEFVISIYSK